MAARPPRRQRMRWLLLALAIVASLYVYRTARQVKKVRYPANAFFQVKRGDLLISVIEDGALRAVNETSIRSGLEGLNRIIGLVPEGTYVKKGELLVELDSSGLKDRLNEQELAYEERKFFLLQARENLKFQKSLADSQIKDSELRVEIAQGDFEKYRDGDAPLLIKVAEARIGVLKEQVRIATERFARTQQLFKQNNATRSELEADELSLKREQLGLEQYEEDLRLIKKFDQPTMLRSMQAKIEQSKDDLERLKQRSANEIAQIEADLKTSERSAELMEESLANLRRKLQNAKIYAPQDGLVVYAEVSPFQFMGGGRGDSMPQEGRFRTRDGRPFFSDGGGGGGGGRGDRRRGSGGFGYSAEIGTLASSSGSSSTSSRFSSGGSGAAVAANVAAGATPATGGSSAGSSSGGRGGGAAPSSQGGANQSSGFVSYTSLRPSSTLGTSSAGSGSGSGSSLSSSSGSSSGSSGGQGGSYSSGMNQNSYRSQYNNYGPSEIYGSPTVIEEGTMVRQRQELIRLPDISKMLAEIKIREEYVRLVRAGMTAYVRVETVPDRRFKATVRRVALMPDAQASWMNPDVKVFPTDLLIDDELPALKPGVSARVEIIVTNLPKVLSVPIQAVVRDKGQYVCFVKHGLKVIPSPVKTGFANDRFIEVISGLEDGDHVLLAPTGDEEIEVSAKDTNAVENATIETNAAPSMENAPAEREPGERRGGRSGRGPGGGGRRQRDPDQTENTPQ
jgi:multidrug efflux pump subunit AcrA (membrane-fusion protein)